MCNVNAYSEAIKIFGTKNPDEMAGNAGGEYYTGQGIIELKYFNARVRVNYPSGEIWIDAPWKIVKNDKVLILQYLISSCGIEPRLNWISFIQLPNGPHHHAPFVLDAITPIARDFGENIEGFKRQVKLFGGQDLKMGDYGVIIPVFPLIPLAICLWKGDEEFAPNANILFDVTAPLHLTTAALWVLGVEVSHKIRGIVGQQYS